MIPKRIVLENFLSFGSPETVLEFTDGEPLWVLAGVNGVGKSAVFDALTYALYAEHRGGASDYSSLVRHGTNGFRVVLEFEFNGSVYQIARNRPVNGRPSQSIKQWVDGGWNKAIPLPNVGRLDAVRVWVERTLGLGFDAFTASVLLRQGHADRILNARGSERLAILEGIIAAERYKALSKDIHDALRTWKERCKGLATERDALIQERGGAPTALVVQAAQTALQEAEEWRSTARERVATAERCLVEARNWNLLDGKRQRLQQQLQDADARATVAERIRTEKARLDELTAVVPVLREILESRARLDADMQRLETLQEGLAERTAEQERLRSAVAQARQKEEAHRRRAEECDREAKRLRGEIEREDQCLKAAEDSARLRAERDAFPTDLAEQVNEAEREVQAATAAGSSAAQEKRTAAELLKVVTGQQQKFATVGVGVNCSLCGQEVTAEHAERERNRLQAEARELQCRIREAEAAETRARATKAAAEGVWKQLDSRQRRFASIGEQLAARLQVLAELGVTANAEELRHGLEEKRASAAWHERNRVLEQSGQVAAQTEASGLDGELEAIGSTITSLTLQIHNYQQDLSQARGRQDSRLGQLTPSWRERATDLERQTVERLQSERVALDLAEVQQRFRELEQDAVLRAEWDAQLSEVSTAIARIGPEARVPVSEAEEAARVARVDARDADLRRDAAREAQQELARREAEHNRLVHAIREAERQTDLHLKLDELLGKGGLQRELVRNAEREIVRLANDTVQNLSNGELTIELEGSEGGDKAFALCVRRLAGPPIGVTYLSGSQKFRVAISIALAIGRFAAGQARPLESVIIDEGFGSLDRDGLLAAADELNRLSRHLRRIIVVSHQEEFANRFPVVIQLTPGANGTTANASRR